MAGINAYKLARRLPVVDFLADQRLVHKLKRYLGTLGHAEFTTDASTYKPATHKNPAYLGRQRSGPGSRALAEPRAERYRQRPPPDRAGSRRELVTYQRTVLAAETYPVISTRSLPCSVSSVLALLPFRSLFAPPASSSLTRSQADGSTRPPEPVRSAPS